MWPGDLRASSKSILAIATHYQVGGASTNRYTLRHADTIELRGGIRVSSPRSIIAVGGMCGDRQSADGK